MDTSFQGKNIIVTGAGQGIGRAVCEQLYKCGATVYAFSRSPEPLAELVAQCPTVIARPVDLGDWQATIEAFGPMQGIPIHGLVNNAGVALWKPFLETEEADVDRLVAVNFKGAINVTKQVIPLLSDGAAIVNVSSLASRIASPNLAVYSATKAALDSLTRSWAMELAPRRIRVNSVNPTAVLTALGRLNWSDAAKVEPLKARTPLGRIAELNEVVEPIVWLLSDRSSFVDGHCLPIEGAFRWVFGRHPPMSSVLANVNGLLALCKTM